MHGDRRGPRGGFPDKETSGGELHRHLKLPRWMHAEASILKSLVTACALRLFNMASGIAGERQWGESSALKVFADDRGVQREEVPTHALSPNGDCGKVLAIFWKWGTLGYIKFLIFNSSALSCLWILCALHRRAIKLCSDWVMSSGNELLTELIPPHPRW